MRTIYKYALMTTDKQTINVPFLNNDDNIGVPFKDQVLKVDVQNNQIFIWCLVDDELYKGTRTIYIYGTGHQIDDKISKENYIGTYQLNNGSFIGHVFID